MLARQFRLHLHRGIGYLAAPQTIRSIGDLMRLAGEESGHDTREANSKVSRDEQ